MSLAESLDTTATSARLLRLTSVPARVVVGIFMAANALYAFSTLDVVAADWTTIVSMVLVNVGAALLLVDRPDPYPWRYALTIVAIVLVANVLIMPQLPVEGSPGRAAWQLGSCTWLLFFVALRRRPGLAWIGFALQATVVMVWTVWAHRSIVDGVMQLRTHAVLLLLATLFEVNLRRTSRLLIALETRGVDDAEQAARATTAAQIRADRLAQLESAAAPALRRIASGATPTAAERREFASIEAMLRDGVRGKALATDAVAQAAARARLRGIEVVLLDDRRGALPPDVTARVESEVVAALDAAAAGTVTARLAPEGRSVAVSIVTASEEARTRIDLDDAGERIATVRA